MVAAACPECDLLFGVLGQQDGAGGSHRSATDDRDPLRHRLLLKVTPAQRTALQAAYRDRILDQAEAQLK